ncbi:trypsin-like peptidase domain-containing protein [Streptomyces sp. NPDC058092]|uniref:trypsin-like peptidase domain-containing protein n=1 Tax=Streptomyces sp. NPDC058092 TaxID=3346336 RepID=UPI0036EC4BFE
MSPVDTARVAEVLVRRGDTAEYGSGYRIASRLILTVAHLLGDGDGQEDALCTVLLGGQDTQLPATPVWRSSSKDLALLRLDTPVVDRIAPVVFGRLPEGLASIPFTGVGFPAFAIRPESEGKKGLRRRESKQVTGFVQLGSNMKSELLDLTFTTVPPTEPARGKPDPWRGISGAALFADGSGLLIGVQAQRLPAAGTNSAEAEPISAALDDPEFCSVLAHSGVPSWAEPVGLPGGDTRSPLRAVISQQDLIDGFPEFKKNLTPERLTFVSPGSDHPAEPGKLFVRLVNARDRGVLLVGAAGAGKTRTCIEVGRLALEAGWRVLHVVPGEEASINDRIAQEVLAEPTPVLVVVDYLNEAQLDLPTLRHQLIPEARRRHIHVALIASVRPGWLKLKKSNSALLHQLFDEVELRQDDEFQRQLTDNALTTLAPTAIRRLGMDRMLAVCGRRPIVALLVAREMERRVKERLSIPETAGLREGGELPAWLASRLGEDELTVPGRPNTYSPARAPRVLVAAAAAAAACPQTRPAVVAAARAALAGAVETGEDVAGTPDAEAVVTTLVSLGWLESDGEGVLSVAHDIVADQLMESVLLPERDGDPDVTGSYAMLTGCLTSPRTVGRFAVNVTRLVNDMVLADRAGPFIAVLDGWFTGQAGTIGRIMRYDSSVGSYALGAVFSGPPWSATAVRCWKQVVSPWLAGFGTDVNARHLLYRGLRHLPDHGAQLLVPTALAWLRSHGQAHEANFVLGPLLSRTDLTPDDAQQAIAAALTWLNTDDRTSNAEAQFVLDPLLNRPDLTPDDARSAITTALTWLHTDDRTTAPEAQYVLNSLLDRTDLTPDDAQQVTAAALTWLGTDDHNTVVEAGFVLDPLIKRADLTPHHSQKAIAATFTWLDTDDHATRFEAQFVLNSLLPRTDLTPDDAQKAITTTLTWLHTDDHNTVVEAGFVLDPLLERTDLTPHHSQKAIAATLTWLDTDDHATHLGAQFVLNSLLPRTDLTPDDAQKAITTTLTWLHTDDHAATTGAEFLLGALLRRLPIDDVPAEVTEFVDAWIGTQVPGRDFSFLSKWVLRKQLMSPTILKALLTWVHANPDHEDLVPRMASAGFQVGPYLASWESSRSWLRAIELSLDHAERHGPASNLNGALDVLICQLATAFTTGVGAAWADDCIQRWLALPFSMNTAVFRPHVSIVGRCHALILSGRFAEAEGRELAERLHRWVSQWAPGTRNTEALAFIDAHMLSDNGHHTLTTADITPRERRADTEDPASRSER